MIAICCMVSCNMVANAGNDKPISVNALPAKGAFYTGKYTNHFKHVLGISQEQVDARMDSLWQHFFTPGDFSRFAQADQSTVYYEVNDSMAFVYDVGSDDVRTEGMSYGMMICLQLDKPKQFDRLWRWPRPTCAIPIHRPGAVISAGNARPTAHPSDTRTQATARFISLPHSSWQPTDGTTLNMRMMRWIFSTKQ